MPDVNFILVIMLHIHIVHWSSWKMLRKNDKRVYEKENNGRNLNF